MTDLLSMLFILLMAWLAAISWYAWQLHMLINEMNVQFIKRELWKQPGDEQ